MRDFKELEVWVLGHELALKMYKVTAEFPKEELYGLTSQMRRSSQSIPTNIAEGCGRNSEKELLRFCSIAMGSASELEYQLLLSRDLKFINSEVYEELYEALVLQKKKLNAFIKYLRSQQPKNQNTSV